MKLIFTISDASHLVHAGGELEKTSYVVEVPSDNMPIEIKEHLSKLNKNESYYRSMSISILRDAEEVK